MGRAFCDTGEHKGRIRMLRENGHLAFRSGRTRAFIQDERLLALGFDGIVAGCGTWIEMDGKTLFLKKIRTGIDRGYHTYIKRVWNSYGI